MTEHTHQLKLFHHLRTLIPEHLSLASEVSEILHISEDSAYRRIRAEKPLALDEIQTICRHYSISIDALVGRTSNNIIFTGNYIRPSDFRLELLLANMAKMLEGVQQLSEKEIIFFSKDIPPYHYFLFPEIARFKFFSWMKTLLDFPELRGTRYSGSLVTEDMLLAGKRLAELYYKIPGAEILNVDNILTTLRQIEYYKDARLFESEAELEQVWKGLEEMINHMESMASSGRKFLPGKDPALSPGEYHLYVNEFYVGDNTFMIKTPHDLQCFLILCGANVFRTADQHFCEYQYKFLRNIISKSSLVSVVNEKERVTLFQKIRERICAYRENRIQTLGNI